VAHAIACAAYVRTKEEGIADAEYPSPTFIFANACLKGGYNGTNGAAPFDAIQAMADSGFCGLDACPDTEKEMTELATGDLAYRTPSADAYRLAADQRTIRTYRISDIPTQTIDQIKTAISTGYPVTIAFQVDQSFMDLTSKFVWNGPEGMVLGGHYVCAVGYGTNGLVIVNSWSREWADNGIGIVGWDVVGNSEITSDCWAVTFAEQVEVK
jgi:hypothetical protein